MQRMHAHCTVDRRVDMKWCGERTSSALHGGVKKRPGCSKPSRSEQRMDRRQSSAAKANAQARSTGGFDRDEARDEHRSSESELHGIAMGNRAPIRSPNRIEEPGKWRTSRCVMPERFRKGIRRAARSGPGHVEATVVSVPHSLGLHCSTERNSPSAYHASKWTQVGALQRQETLKQGTGSRVTARHEPDRHRTDGCGGRPQGRDPPGSRPRGSRPREANRDAKQS